ncbi:MAG: hypothetical protein H6627_07350 [Calditrichae bacterium]|nr:hypothetical protein [Calditrichota bacterium]MCB9058365.1 hypothetical protein [Calditrichia bacterium]
MSDLASGIPIGIPLGIPIGMGLGKKNAHSEMENKLRELSLTHDIKIKKPDGNFMPIDELISILGAQPNSQENKKPLVIITILGIMVLILAILAYFSM